MGTGYTRNDTANNIADGNVINASDLDGEFDAIQAAFNASTGHSHDGTTGEGPQIGTGGIADLAVTTGKIANDAVTLGTKTSGNYVATGAVSGVGLSGSASAEGATFTVTSNATDANTASTIVARDASGNFSAGNVTVGNLITAGNVDGRDVSADGSKLDGIEAGATADQTAAEIRTLVESATDSNVFTDADHSKLNGIEAGATADQTASEILTLIKTVDGAGSGLDADTLDGVSSASFLRSDAADTKTAGDLSFADSVKATFGAGNDLQIYHDGSASYIDEAGTGSLYIRSNGTQVFITDSTSTNHMARFTPSGASTLYYSGATKLATKTDGVDITGELQADSLDIDGAADISGQTNFHSNVVLDDSNTLYFGNGLDLRIYHDGSHSYVKDAGTGNLYIEGTNLRLGYANGEYAMIASENGSVEILHDNATKLATTSSGVTVTGSVIADGLFLGDGESAYFGTGNDLRIYHNSSNGNSYITEGGSGSLVINGDNLYLQNAAGTENYVSCNANGSVDLYYNNAVKLQTTNSGIDLTGDINDVANIYLGASVIHAGDTDTYMQFQAADTWRVVTGNTEMLSINNNYVSLGANTVARVDSSSRTGSVTPDLYEYNSFVWTLTGNITLNNPTTEGAGMSGVFIFIHSGAGRTVSLGTDWETAGGAGLTLSSTAGAVDIVPYFVQAGGNILLGTPQLAFA